MKQDSEAHFFLADAGEACPKLMERSAAAGEVAASIEIGLVERSRLLLKRVAV